MSFDLTVGEWVLIGFIFLLVYSAGLLPRISARLGGAGDGSKGES